MIEETLRMYVCVCVCVCLENMENISLTLRYSKTVVTPLPIVNNAGYQILIVLYADFCIYNWVKLSSRSIHAR